VDEEQYLRSKEQLTKKQLSGTSESQTTLFHSPKADPKGGVHVH
jgi:hypothetical protein